MDDPDRPWAVDAAGVWRSGRRATPAAPGRRRSGVDGDAGRPRNRGFTRVPDWRVHRGGRD